MLKRILEVIVTAQDVDAALQSYERNLGLRVMGCAQGEEGHIRLGETSLVVMRPDIARRRLPHLEGGEGLAALALEVDDVEGTVSRLRRQGIEVEGPVADGERGVKVARVPPQFAHGVPIELVQRL